MDQIETRHALASMRRLWESAWRMATRQKAGESEVPGAASLQTQRPSYDPALHGFYVEVLQRSLLEPSPPRNIALAGAFGAGKSSILKGLQNSIGEKTVLTVSLATLNQSDQAIREATGEKTIAIAREVFEHCVWYFLRPGGAPQIIVRDNDESVSLASLMDEFVFSELPRLTLDLKGEKFDLLSLFLKATSRSTSPKLYWCAANRVVSEENLTGQVPGLYGRLKDSTDTEFTYVGYLSADYLDAHVRSDRTAFDLDAQLQSETLYSDISIGEICDRVLSGIEDLLEEPLAKAREEGRPRVSDYVSTRAPRYRPVLPKLEALGVTVDPSMKDADLEILLHRNLQKLEANAIAEGHAVFAEVGSVPLEDYQERLSRYLELIKEINQSDLAAYVSRRRVILDLLLKIIRTDEHGKYSREDAVHSLLFPMRADSNDVGSDTSNLWIVDERLAFHDYLASDKTLKSMPITESDSRLEPDTLATRLVDVPVLAAEGEALPLPSIVVIEIKRPMRNDVSDAKDKDPIQQSLEYVNRVREGGVLTASGRPIPGSHDSPAFCYIIADLTTSMVSRCKVANLRKTHDGLGYFGYNEPHKAYIEVISFDGLINAATERNRAFFDKLGLPSS